jgi:histidinol-phosphate aminotransferase
MTNDDRSQTELRKDRTMKSLQELVRPNIWSLAPYSSARNEYAGREARVFLDANENPYNQPYNR